MGMLVFNAWIYAQESQIDSDAPPVFIEMPYEDPPYPATVYPQDVHPSAVIQENIYEPTTMVVDYSPNTFNSLRTSSMAGSFSQNIAWDLRNNFGFSLGVNQGYYFNENYRDNAPSDSTRKQSSSATSVSANVFTNHSGGKSAMHLDYGTGYSFFPGRQNSTDDLNHHASASYRYQINNRASVQIRDNFSLTSNDSYGDIFSLGSSSGSLLSDSSFFDIIFASRRYTRNTVNATFNADVTGKGTNLNFFGLYTNYWYGKHDFGDDVLGDHYSARVGAGLNQRITRWLSLGSTYSIQLNKDLSDSQSHRVEVGRFQFDLSPNIEVYASGGLEFTGINSGDEGYRTRATARAGITYTTEISSLYANYARTMMSVSGFRQLLPSDTVSVGLGQPIGSRLHARLVGNYQRSSAFSESGLLISYQGQASMEYVIAPGLFASCNYTYRRQKNSINSMASISHVERSTISAGLQYSWPSGRSNY